MPKYLVALMLVVGIILLSSCGRGPVLFSDDGQKAETRLEQVINAINGQDKEALKEMFSKQVLDDAEDLDGRIDYLFESTQGDIVSWGDKAGNVNSSNDHGNKRVDSKYEFSIKTEQNEYMIFIFEVTKDTKHPEDIGVFMLQIYDPKDRDSLFDWGNEKKCAGIYPPGKTEDGSSN